MTRLSLVTLPLPLPIPLFLTEYHTWHDNFLRKTNWATCISLMSSFCTMKTLLCKPRRHTRVDILLHAFLTPHVEVFGWAPWALTSGTRASRVQWVRNWVRPRAVLDILVNRIFYCPCWELNDTQFIQPAALSLNQLHYWQKCIQSSGLETLKKETAWKIQV